MFTQSRLREREAEKTSFAREQADIGVVGNVNPAEESAASDTAFAGMRRADRASSRNRSSTYEWLGSFGLLCLDVGLWVLLYGAVTSARGDAYFSSPFEFVVVAAIQAAVLVQALYIIGGYDRKTDMLNLLYTTEHILAVMCAAAVSALLIYAATSFAASMKPSRSAFVLSFLAFTPISIFYRRIVSRAAAAATTGRAFLVLGGGELAAEFYQSYRQSPNRQRLEFVSFDKSCVGQHVAGPESPVIEGSVSSKLASLDQRYSGVILAERVDRIQPDLLERLVRTQFQQVRVYTLESFYEAHWRHVPVHSLDPFWPLQMGFQLARASPYHYLKRLFDLVVATLLLVVGCWLLAMIVVAIWLQSGRPILFRQTRLGREGERFTALKFRTMTATLNEPEEIYTREGDARITRVGRWLRKLRLDELPQLVNVLRGEMSLIGPRAEWDKCAMQYEKKIPFYHFRHLVKPGITGWAQVNYPYGESEEDALEKLKYDLYYIRHYSLKLDAMIVLKTVHTMLFGKGR